MICCDVDFSLRPFIVRHVTEFTPASKKGKNAVPHSSQPIRAPLPANKGGHGHAKRPAGAAPSVRSTPNVVPMHPGRYAPRPGMGERARGGSDDAYAGDARAASVRSASSAGEGQSKSKGGGMQMIGSLM